MDLVEARRLVYCERAYEISQLNLSSKRDFPTVWKALEKVKEQLSLHRSQNEIEEELDELFRTEYVPSVEVLACYKEEERQKDIRKVKRLVQYVFDRGYNAHQISTDEVFVYQYDGTFKSQRIHCLSEKADLVFVNDQEARTVKFNLAENPYTNIPRSRNYAGYSESIAVMYKGCKSVFTDKKVVSEIWYLTGKGETDDSPIMEFEYKPTKNIASFSYQDAGTSPEEALERFFSQDVECDCLSCTYRKVCRMKTSEEMKTEHPVIINHAEKKTMSCTEAQRRVIEHVDGPMNVLAGPGSGKSTTLMWRVKRLVDKGVPLKEILLIAFTKKAAKELREKANSMLGEGIGKELEVYTYNAFGYSILTEFPVVVGTRPKLAEDTEIKKILERAVNQVPLIKKQKYARPYLQYGILEKASKWINSIENYGIDSFVAKYQNKVDTGGVIALYKRYKELFNEEGFISYDDQISLVMELFERHPHFAKMFSERYKYIMVDEFQDTSEMQKRMIYSIARHHSNIVVVGDDDQSIYGWRDGNASYLIHFKDDFPNAETVMLTDNFRSNEPILSLAGAVINGNSSSRIEKNIEAHKAAKFLPLYVKMATPEDLIGYVKSLLKGYKPGEIAVLARTNSELYKLESELSKFVPVATPKDYLSEDQFFMVYEALFSLYLDHSDDEALAILFKWFGVSALPRKQSRQGSLYQMLVSTRQMAPFDDEDSLNRTTDIVCAGKKIAECFKIIDKSTKLKDMFDDLDFLLQMPNDIVTERLKDMVEERSQTSVSDILEHMKDMEKYLDKTRVGYEPTPEKINLLTEHDSKGKEFPVVIISGVNEFSGTEEDNNLFYVAITRAKETLVMFDYDVRGYRCFDSIKDFVQVRNGGMSSCMQSGL